MNFYQRCKSIKKHFDGQFSIFFDAGAGGDNQEASAIHDLMRNVSIYGFEASTPRYDALKLSYPGKIYNVMLGDQEKEYKGFLGGAKLCKVPIDNFRININEQEAIDERINFRETSIDCITLDNFYKKHELNGDVFVWADIEGSELLMLRGSTWLLENKKIAGLNLEISDVSWFPSPSEVVGFLEGYGYSPIEEIFLAKGAHKDIFFSRNKK